MRRFDTVLFDLDGTLLDTLEDICGAANHTLRELGYPERTLAEEIAAGLEAGEPKSALAKRLAKSFSLPRAEVYDAVVAAASA